MMFMPHWPKDFLRNLATKDLSRTEIILEKLGNPHYSLPPTIHIAGTNGKGSTCAMLKSILEASGMVVHMYTSPHIVYFNERITISGKAISDQLIFEYMEQVRKVHEELEYIPSFFEAVTACAFYAFSKNPADVLILETGLGGRLDYTNVIPDPVATIITPVSYDHMEYLGDTIAMIAREKAGIIKKGAKSIISLQEQDAMDVLLEVSEKISAETIAYEFDYIPKKTASGFKFYSQMGDIEIDTMSLQGDHQIVNASAVIASTLSLREYFDISNDAIKTGIANAYWPGRLQKHSLAKLKNGKGLHCFLDAAHNIGGAISLNNWIIDQKLKKPLIIFGCTKNRDIVSLLSQFTESRPRFFVVPVLSEPLSYSSESIFQIAKNANIDVEPKDSLILALEEAILEGYGNEIIICGSIYLLSDFFKL